MVERTGRKCCVRVQGQKENFNEGLSGKETGDDKDEISSNLDASTLSDFFHFLKSSKVSETQGSMVEVDPKVAGIEGGEET